MCDEQPYPYTSDVGVLVDLFETWMSNFEHQYGFHSLQAAFNNWLEDSGYGNVNGDYTTAVAVILTYMSLCLANPHHRRYLSNLPSEPEEFTWLQVKAPEEGYDVTFWEFFTEKNFQERYAYWLERRRADN